MRGVTIEAYVDVNVLAISTHTPHARRDYTAFDVLKSYIKFQLTRLMRGVTQGYFSAILDFRNFNSHASCEA